MLSLGAWAEAACCNFLLDLYLSPSQKTAGNVLWFTFQSLLGDNVVVGAIFVE